MKGLVYLLIVGLWGATATFAAQPNNGQSKQSAYELLRKNQVADAAAQFAAYCGQHPEDVQTAVDYAAVLSQLDRHGEAAQVLDGVHERAPANESAYFKLGVEYVRLNRSADAERVFTELSKSGNADMARAASESLGRLKSDVAGAARARAEQRVFDLAKESKYREMLQAIAELEKTGEVPLSIEIQGIYGMQALQEYAQALERADALARKHPESDDLQLVRADLLAQLGRRPEAEQIWRRIVEQRPNTAPALTASQRLQSVGRPEEDRIYALARQGRSREVIEAIDELERKEGRLSWPMQMQRLYALQGAGEVQRALDEATRLSASHPESTELVFVRADILLKQHRWNEAAVLLKQVKDSHPASPVADQARTRLQSMPAMANLDKWYWGEAYVSGDYLGRFGTVVGSGFIRHGFYIQNLRWLQPYAEMRFTADTRSGVGRGRSIIADNFVGFSAGVRAQPLVSEYLFAYAQAGVNTDLLERRDHGDWTEDYQVGLYGFKSWGPGTVLHAGTAGDLPTAGSAPPSAANSGSGQSAAAAPADLWWRGDWFVDAGADFSYYHRFANWIGYGQAHEGLRLAQWGPRTAFDAYAVENMSWDARGNYFDNLVELGPGVRMLWVPRRGWEVVLRGEYLNGFYFGRDGRNNRDGASGHYDDLRAALSVGLRW